MLQGLVVCMLRGWLQLRACFVLLMLCTMQLQACACRQMPGANMWPSESAVLGALR